MSDAKRINELKGAILRMESDMRKVKATGGHIGPNEPLAKNYMNAVRELNSATKGKK